MTECFHYNRDLVASEDNEWFEGNELAVNTNITTKHTHAPAFRYTFNSGIKIYSVSLNAFWPDSFNS